MFKNHPSGLPYLFLTELWERFGYYLMIGIFLLYMTDSEHGGLAMTRTQGSDIYGTFIALVYITPFVGGLLADKLLGYRRSIVLGGTLMGIGYLMLAVSNQSMPVFYTSLFVMILGNGFFKPNISVLLGNLYNENKYRTLKDTGYNIFYMGINIGAFICNFFAAWLRHNIGWGAAFAAAGIGMFIGVIVFAIGSRHYAHADIRQPKVEGELGVGRMLSSVLLPAIVTGIAGWMIPGNIFGTDSTDAFLFGSIPIVAFYLWTYWKASEEDKPRIKVLLSIYAVVIIFWAVFKQNGTALTTWAEYYTDREMPAWIAGPAETIKMSQVVTMKDTLYTLYDEQFRTTPGPDGKPMKINTFNPYFLNIPEAERPDPEVKVSLVSTELYQSVNPFFVVIFTPLVIWFFSYLRKRGKEPTTPAKIGWGIVVTALSTLVTVMAVYACHNGMEKASAWWIIATYGVITIGELFLSPMGLSMVSKMAPAHITGLMMGGWQLATALGNKLSGVLATMWDRYDDKANFFWVNFVLLSLAALALFSMLKWLNKVFREKGLT